MPGRFPSRVPSTGSRSTSFPATGRSLATLAARQNRQVLGRLPQSRHRRRHHPAFRRATTAPSMPSSPNARNPTASPAPSLRSPAGFPPLITAVHDLRYQFHSGGVRFIRKSSLGFVFRRSARVVANSAQTATWLQREYGVPENKIGQCRIHLTAPFLQRAAQGSAPIDPGRPSAFYFSARSIRKKAPDIFLRAAHPSRARSSRLRPSCSSAPKPPNDPRLSRDAAGSSHSHPAVAHRLEMPGPPRTLRRHRPDSPRPRRRLPLAHRNFFPHHDRGPRARSSRHRHRNHRRGPLGAIDRLRLRHPAQRSRRAGPRHPRLALRVKSPTPPPPSPPN